MRRYFWSFILILGLTISSAWAGISLQQAKAGGWVGELYTGYVALTPEGKKQSNVKELNALVASINKRRKAAYQQIATKEGTSLKVVEALAGEKSLKKTPPGQFIQLPEKGWLRK